MRPLGETIAKNEQPTFLIATTKDGKTTESQAYYPDISYNQEEAKWEYSSTWDTTTLDHLAEVEEIRVKGTGLDNALPKTGMAEAMKGFKDFCAALDTGGGANGGDGGDGGAPDRALVERQGRYSRRHETEGSNEEALRDVADDGAAFGRRPRGRPARMAVRSR